MLKEQIITIRYKYIPQSIPERVVISSIIKLQYTIVIDTDHGAVSVREAEGNRGFSGQNNYLGHYNENITVADGHHCVDVGTTG